MTKGVRDQDGVTLVNRTRQLTAPLLSIRSSEFPGGPEVGELELFHCISLVLLIKSLQ
jgi:hypothetical protein